MNAIIRFISGFFVNQGRTDDPDPVTGLTSRDVYLITNSWKVVMKDPKANGIKLFLRLFEIQPIHHKAFPFRDVPIEELAKNKKFHAHVNVVMYSISSIINNLNDINVLTALIEKIGSSHARRAVNRQAFIDVKSALLDIFTFMTKEELDSWSKMLDVFVQVATKSLEEAKTETA